MHARFISELDLGFKSMDLNWKCVDSRVCRDYGWVDSTTSLQTD